MKSVLGRLGIFLTLISTGQALSCTQCVEIGSSSCTGPSVTCQSGDVCGTSYTLNSKLGVMLSEIYRRECIPKPTCNVEGTLSIWYNIRVQFGTSCCETENCTPPVPKLSTLNTVANGLICPVCFSEDSLSCHSNETLQCSGDETMCFLQTMKALGHIPSQTAHRGCATKTICDIRKLSTFSGDLKFDSEFICASGQALSCTQCFDMGSSSCTGPSITCPSGYVCGTSYTVNSKLGVKETEIYKRDCVPKSICNVDGTVSTVGNLRIQIAMSCCETENCTPPEPKLPTLSAVANGLICPVCISTDSLSCHSNKTLQCSGNETMCFLQTMKAIEPIRFQMALCGCTTKIICDIGTLSTTSVDIKMDSEFICTPGQPLSCTQCVDMGSSSCTGPSIICQSGDVCGTSHTVFSKFGSKVSEMYKRDCVPKSTCNMGGNMSVRDNIRIQIGTSCCEMENCTPPQPKLPALNNEANGLSCPTCVSSNSLWCQKDETVPCSGNETMCLLQTNKITGPIPFQTELRGCATRTVCDIGTQTASSKDMEKDYEFTCTLGK